MIVSGVGPKAVEDYKAIANYLASNPTHSVARAAGKTRASANAYYTVRKKLGSGETRREDTITTTKIDDNTVVARVNGVHFSGAPAQVAEAVRRFQELN